MYLYLHIPFCKSKCIYCDFAVVLYKYGGQQAYVDAACQEIQARFKNIPPQPITTLYVGGGTPSLLPASLYQQIFDCLNQYTTSADNVEITLEINPEAMADDSAAYRALGFNRVSVGIQSFDDAELKKLSRIHTAQHAIDAIHRLNKAGFN
ncbi:MAG: radical SAM protein, partial [Vampirovibrio sp.]|nr:radical SAM protein [Vampirovibrio sp.]